MIDEVLKASDIKFENGRIYMQAGKEVIAETPVISEEVSAEIVGQDKPEADIEWADYLKRRDAASKALLFDAAQRKFGKSYSKKEFNMMLGGLLSGKVYKNKAFSKRVQAFSDMIKQPDDRLQGNLDPAWAEYGYVSNGENDEELVEKALNDLMYNRTRPISPDEEFANYVEEETNKIKAKFDNAQTLDELYDLYFNELNNLPKNLDEEYIVAEISKSFKENEQRLENEQRKNNESTPRNANEISESDIGRPQADTGGLIQENTNQQQGQNQEINPDTKLYQETSEFKKYFQLKNTPKQQKIFKGAYDVSAKAIELFKDADYSTLPHELVQVYKKKKLPRENWQH